MSARRWQQLDEIFSQALELPAAERAGFVTRRCGDDTGLRDEVTALLTASDHAETFMASPAVDWLSQAMVADGYVLEAGEQVGAYTVRDLLGSGGAGAVWRARDERLDRDVAIKVLLPSFAVNPEQVRRFASEARAAGALNHPNVLAVYDVGEHHGAPFIVSECLDGMSLRARLMRGPLPVRDVLPVLLGVGRGLAAAHARGIVHRDLKPENVFLRSDGGVKILDFGLAKLHASPSSSPFPPSVPDADVTRPLGLVMGTAGYVAPEVLAGAEADARSDLFALGVIAYEMLAGKRPFAGNSTFEALHAVMTTDPADISTVAPSTPPALARIIMRLLAKRPDDRFHSASDLVWALDELGAGPVSVSRPSAGTARRLALPALIAGAALVAGWLIFGRAAPPAAPALTRFTWTLPEGLALASPAVVSPDGRRMAFVGSDGRANRVFVRDLSSDAPIPIAGTEGAKHPFWSPDGRSLGYFARGQLLTVAVEGGAPTLVAQAPDARGGSWGAAGAIVFSPDLVGRGIWRAPASGGPAEPVTAIELSDLDVPSHRFPSFLPDGRHFLYFVVSSQDDRRGIFIADADTAVPTQGTRLVRSEAEGVVVPGRDEAGDLLLTLADGGITVYTLTGATPAVTGRPRRLDLEAGGHTLHQPMMVSASADVLAYTTAPLPLGDRLEVIGRDGRSLGVMSEPEQQNWPRVSPDGRRLARVRIDALRGNPDIWVDDLILGSRLRLPTTAWPDMLFAWSPAGNELVFVVGLPPGRPGPWTLNVAAADGSGTRWAAPCPVGYCEPTDWTADGRILLNVRRERDTDIWMMDADGGHDARPWLAEAHAERDAKISPDGRWIAYVSSETGRPEVSVRPVSAPSPRLVVSSAGGDQPVWRRDGRELFFVSPDGRLHAVPVTWPAGAAPTFGRAVPLDLPLVGFGHWGTQYDVSPDGSRFYMLRPNDAPSPREVHVVLGWQALLRNHE